VKIQITDLDRGRDIVEWLKKNVGPQLRGYPGTAVYGEGWSFWVNMHYEAGPIVTFELNEEHVDEDTVLLFALMWSGK
jgi:hypothetical protein